MPLTYASYLEIDELLSLQQPRSTGPAHDEPLFIVVHQVHELWFKLLLHELDHLCALLDDDDDSSARATLKRAVAIVRTLAAAFDVLETLTPAQFSTFRSTLGTSSGFQSVQFREFEFTLGLKSAEVLERFAAQPSHHRRLAERLGQPSVWDAFVAHLARAGHPVPKSQLRRRRHGAPPRSPKLRRALRAVHREDGPRAELCELLLDLDELVQHWRYRHVMLVERAIGAKSGTGGSAGVEYLKSTLFRPCFPELWAIRGELLSGD